MHISWIFQMLKTTTKGKKLTTCWSWARSPQTFWSLRLIMLTPGTPPCYLTINQSENCAAADHRPLDAPPSLAFKNALLKPLREFGMFWTRATHSRPFDKPFSAQNSDVSVCLASLWEGNMNWCSVTKEQGHVSVFQVRVVSIFYYQRQT